MRRPVALIKPKQSPGPGGTGRSVGKQPGGAMVEDVRGAYEELIRRARELGVLASCSALLGWDEQTYMPPGGSAHRGEQCAHLAGLHHERATDGRIGELLAIVEGSDLLADPDTPPAVNTRELRRSYERRT